MQFSSWKNLVEYLVKSIVSKPDMVSVKNIGEVFCDCNAFRYNTAYPDIQAKTFFGQPQGYNRIPNKIRNPAKIPTVCKHLYSFLIYLYNKNLIKNN